MLYFAYGSNMNWHQMKQRCPSAQFICVARLPDYRWAIARHSRLRKCGTANIFAENDCEVVGVVYEVSDCDLAVLDRFEDGYIREIVSVYALNDGNSPLKALVYIAPRENTAPLPNPEYKRLMLEGAKYWSLPPAYISTLETIEAG